VSDAQGWTLDPTTEAAYLIPWLDSDPDPQTLFVVLTYLSGLLRDPVRAHIENGSNVYGGVIPGTDVGIIYSLDWPARQVLLALLG
jgi:hypothetical protein